ncbi:MAG: FIST C-terminal domain-containing protein [Sulfurimonas sp.]|uniref:FIST signal transduction protein n=1 Tax=Sulfurimonas sp. TaxID=2022749 RepID=UPI0025E11851|nr:FIST N-terminal domain-containing protein [Sulfurimonas sp.]MCK9491706.1 FIST C-terminal domain-containing protein [Sulfurimonas sp.]
MQIETYLFEDGVWNKELDSTLDSLNTLIIMFGSINILNVKDGIDDIVESFPMSTIVGTSSSGEIYDSEIFHDSLSVSVVKFSKSRFKVLLKEISEENSFEVGKKIVEEINGDHLKCIFVLSSVVNVNGSELTKGLSFNAPQECVITGGLAGDGVEFNKIWILLGSKLMRKQIVAVGLYGKALRVGSGCRCGWSRFGLDRRVTSSEKNILYSIDNKPALELYKRYLGPYADELPASGLYFPLMLLEEGSKTPTLRAIKAIDEEKNSITLAASIPEGSIVTFAKANLDDLIGGAQEVAESLMFSYDGRQKALCVAINCVARKIVLKQEAEDEIEVVKDILGENVSLVGFYSYGEISNISEGGCDFHNQSMTLMLLYEEENYV